jgi:hypothetical protein
MQNAAQATRRPKGSYQTIKLCNEHIRSLLRGRQPGGARCQALRTGFCGPSSAADAGLRRNSGGATTATGSAPAASVAPSSQRPDAIAQRTHLGVCHLPAQDQRHPALAPNAGGRSARQALARSLGSAEGAIMQSGADYVTLPTTEGEMQFWAHSFAEAYFQLTNKPWQAGEEAR